MNSNKNNSLPPSRTSNRKIKRVKFFDVDEPVKRQRRKCEKTGCNDEEPRCCLQASDTCCRDGYTSRWYHMSLGEHFCNECFDHYYRPQKGGHKEFDSWSHSWFSTSHFKPTMKRFVAEEAMPYWLCCTSPKCGKWREVQPTSEPNPDYISSFKCEMVFKKVQKNPCSVVEESCVADVKKSDWLEQVVEIPLLKKSPAAPYLRQFYPEGIGVSPTNSSTSPIEPPKWIELFNESFNGESRVWARPDIMESDEIEYMAQTLLASSTYLGIRNLILAVWNMLPQEWINVGKVSMYMICRGLIRIKLLSNVDRIIRYLTQKASINFGLVQPPKDYCLTSAPADSILIIGAGTAGLSAARHLQNLGIKTIVVEAQSRIGGRVRDDIISGYGAQFIFGLINNPFTTMCYQAGLKILEMDGETILINENGQIIGDEIIVRMQHQFSGIMHGALEWAQESHEDANWFDTIAKHQKDFHQLAEFSPEEDEVFDLYLKLNEIDKRTNTKQLTLLNWEFPKTLGNDGFIAEGLASILDILAEGLDIRFNRKVVSVDYELGEICVKTTKESFKASKVLVTVPLNLLSHDVIEFEPPLPENKITAIQQLGANITYEKIFLQFPQKFWSCLLKENCIKFCIICAKKQAFQYFIDVTTENDKPTLMTFITDCSADLVKRLDDKKIVQMCLKTLKKPFDKLKVKIPEPTCSFVTHWNQDPFAGSFGSFVKVGCAFDAYDELAETVDNKLYFAGEATFRKCPNSMTGAYLSGLREATKIADDIIPLFSC